MKKKLALLVAPVVMLAASAATAETQWGVTPYVGADAEWRHIGLQRGAGKNLFSHDYPQGNIYAGVKFNEYVGVEVGYEATERKTRTVTLGPGELTNAVNGIVVPEGYTVSYNSTGQYKGPHADLMGFYPICDSYRLSLIGLVGIANLKANFTRVLFNASGISTNVISTYMKKKAILRLGAGIQHMISEQWGVRAMVKWENTDKLTNIGSQIGANTSTVVGNNNSFIYSIGAFVKF